MRLSADFAPGSLVLVRAPYIGAGNYGRDEETGLTMVVVGPCGPADLKLARIGNDTWDVIIHVGRCTPVEVRA